MQPQNTKPTLRKKYQAWMLPRIGLRLVQSEGEQNVQCNHVNKNKEEKTIIHSFSMIMGDRKSTLF